MNAFELMKHIGFGGSGGITITGDFVTTDITPSFDVTSTNGTTLTVNWGDGTSAEDFSMTGAKVDVDRNYGTAGRRGISFGGNGNSPMTYLYCNTNSLTSLDVSTNTALTTLYCNTNSLTSLDVSTNTALIYLYCNTNSLTSLDVSTNTALTNFNCRSNSLTSLDVSTNTALTYLHCATNTLTALDISNNTLLTDLHCYNNQLPSTNINAHLAQLVANGLSNGTYNGGNQTPSAPPTGQGITDKATLISRGWTVTTD